MHLSRHSTIRIRLCLSPQGSPAALLIGAGVSSALQERHVTLGSAYAR
jgi:hypothetical protein